MDRFMEDAGSRREALGQMLTALVFSALAAVYFRDAYLPALRLKSLGGKLLACGCVALLLAAAVYGGIRLLVRHLGKCSLGRLISAGICLGNFVFLFDGQARVQPSGGTVVLLLGITLAGCYVLCWGFRDPRMEKYRNTPAALAALGVSVYAALASFGQRYFLEGNSRMHFPAEGLVCCTSGVLWFFPVVLLGLYLLELAAGDRTPRTARTRRRDGCALFAALAAVQGILLWIFWPGFFPDDAYNQLRMAIGTAPLNDWHPVLVSLLQRAVMAVFGNAGMIVAVQMMLMLWLLTAYLMMGYDRGIAWWKLWLLGSIFLVLPNQALSWSSAVKDYGYTLALLWGTYLMLQFVVNDAKIAVGGKHYVCLFLDLFLIAGLRHNGMVPFVLMGFACIYLTVRRFAAVKLRAVGTFCLALVAVVIYRGPVYQALGVVPNIQSPYTSMLCAVGSYINKGLPLSEESQAIMERVMPMEDWADYYSRYEGHDVYYWGRPEGAVPYDTSDIHAGDAFRVYLEALGKAPDVIAKDRLDGMDILWDVAMPEDSFNANAFHYVFTYDEPLDCIPMAHMETEDGHRYYKQTPLAQAYFSTTEVDIHSAANMLLWRTGAYLIALLVLLIFWWRNHMGSMYLAAVPLIGNGAASVLVLYHQSFRYVYFVQVLTLALIFATILLRGELAPAPGKKEKGRRP